MNNLESAKKEYRKTLEEARKEYLSLCDQGKGHEFFKADIDDLMNMANGHLLEAVICGLECAFALGYEKALENMKKA